jgi:glutamate/tyrosine decarboxylase-like PLP-dependent enzyme
VELSPTTVGVLVLAAVVLGGVGCVTAAVALRNQRKVRRAYRAFSMGGRDDVLTLLERHISEVRRLRSEVAELRRYAEHLRDLDRQAISKIGSVRYDAFEDMGGQLSFSLALLDERHDGMVVTAINGRTDTRVYVKPVTAGRSRHNLSEEEAAAIEQARAQPRRGRPARPPSAGEPHREQAAVESS